MPNSDTPNQRFGRIVELLRRYDVEFIVIGGQAEVLMGSPRVTYDTDLTYRRTSDNLKKLAAALIEIRASLRGVPDNVPFRLDAKTLSLGSNFTFETTLGPLDLLGFVEPLGEFEQVQKNQETVDYQASALSIISLEDLILVKRHINRSKDRDSLYQLLAIREHRARQARGESNF